MTDDTAAPEPAPGVAPPAEPVAEAAPAPEPVAEIVAEVEVPQAVSPPAAPESQPEIASVETVAVETAPVQPQPQSAPPPTPSTTSLWNKVDPARARAGRTQRINEQLEKILAFAHTKASVTNDEIEKLLHVSDATASRYLRMLVAQGKLVKEGKGRGVKYRIV